jgi:hypothetical protein
MKKKEVITKTISLSEKIKAHKEKKVTVEIKYYKRLYCIQEVEITESQFKKLAKFD